MEQLSSLSLMDAINIQKECLKPKNKWPYHIIMSNIMIKKITGKSNTREHLETKIMFKENFINNQ